MNFKTISPQEFKDFSNKLTSEIDTWHDMTEIYGEWYHEADLAEVIIGAYEGEELIGVVYLKPTYLKDTKEIGIVVKKEHQGKGIGSQLIKEIGVEQNLFAKTLISNQAVNNLLLKNGWEITARFYRDGFQYLKKWKE